MKTLGDVFDCWDSLTEMASDTGFPPERVKKWWQRERIPNKHWPEVMSALRRKGKKLSADDLLVMHTRRSSGSGMRASR
jgi:hypothetical protein